MARIKQMQPPGTKQELLAMLSDTHDADFPIWRTANAYDRCSTLATVLFDTGSAEVTIFGKQPVATHHQLARPPPAGGRSSSNASHAVLVLDWRRPGSWEAALRAQKG